MIYTIFLSKLRSDLSTVELSRFQSAAQALRAHAERNHPGILGIKEFTAPDGERLSIVWARDAAAQDAWRVDPVHVEQQRVGQRDYYDSYQSIVCDEVRSREWSRRGDGGQSQ